MKSATRIAALVILVGLGWLGWKHFFPSEETRIRRLLDDLAQTVSIPPGRSTVAAGLAVDKLLNYVTPDIEAVFDVRGEGQFTLSGREEVRDAAMAAHRNLSNLKVEFLGINISVAAGKQEATVELTVKATESGTKEFFVQEMQLHLRKQDNRWRVYRAQTVKPLRL